MGNPRATRGILADAELLHPGGPRPASADDLVIAVRAESEAIAEQAMEEADRLLKASHEVVQGAGFAPGPQDDGRRR